MGKCLIFCAAGFDGLWEPATPGDYILAADGGLAHLQGLGLTPHEILGDFDSLGYTPQGARVYPVEKDDTDAMLALRRGLALGYREFVIYGGVDGHRLDHTLANIQALRFLAEHGARGILVGRDWLITAIRNGALSLPAGMQGTVSVFCLGPDARGVNIRGLHYPLEHGTLSGGFPLGVSNRFTGCAASVSVDDGCLLVLWQRQKDGR